MAEEKSFFVDVFAGTVAGAAQLLVGHPFDTVKVKLQSAAQVPGVKPSAFSVASQTIINEGIVGIYRGMATPLATVAGFNAILFSSRGAMENLFAHSDGSPLTGLDQALAGAGAGIPASFLACPTELFKCRLQAQGTYETALKRFRAWEAGGKSGPAPRLYRGPIDVARDIVMNEGGVRGLFRGLGITLFREIPGNFAMFGVYEAIKAWAVQARGLNSTSELDKLTLMFAGGCGGTAFWALMFPSDVIKSKIQVDNYLKPRYAGVWDCTVKTFQAEGLAGMYRGLTPALVRSFPANAVSFVVYEAVVSLISSPRL